MTAPLPTLRRSRIASARSAEVRHNRAELKRELTAGAIHLAELLDSPPEWALEMRLEDVLASLPRVGRRIRERAMVVSRTTVWTTLGGLTAPQRATLLEHFQHEHAGIWRLWRVMTHGDCA